MLFNPGPDALFAAGEMVVAIGKQLDLAPMSNVFAWAFRSRQVQDVVILRLCRRGSGGASVLRQGDERPFNI